MSLLQLATGAEVNQVVATIVQPGERAADVKRRLRGKRRPHCPMLFISLKLTAVALLDSM
jgi:hypothetical protein